MTVWIHPRSSYDVSMKDAKVHVIKALLRYFLCVYVIQKIRSMIHRLRYNNNEIVIINTWPELSSLGPDLHEIKRNI